MAFKRHTLPESFASGEALTRDLVGIGFVLSSRAHRNPNIENTLMAAAIEGMAGDYRTLGLLVQWLGIHLQYVNADRLVRLVGVSKDVRVRAFWSAIASWQKGDKRFARLIKLKSKAAIELGSGTEFQIRRHGEDERFKNTALRVPANLLRYRDGDVLLPQELVKRHTGYRCRVIMGPSYRADMWAVAGDSPSLKPSDLARQCYGSFATAWSVIRDKKMAG